MYKYRTNSKIKLFRISAGMQKNYAQLNTPGLSNVF